MATAIASGIDEFWPPDMSKSSVVEERSLTVQRISEDNLVSGIPSVISGIVYETLESKKAPTDVSNDTFFFSSCPPFLFVSLERVQSTSSNPKPDKASGQMDKKFVKNQDSKKVPVGPKGQPSKRNNRKGEKPMRIPQITEPCSGSRLPIISICWNAACKGVKSLLPCCTVLRGVS
ncbi:hypothetical protein HanIR_Chr11g0504411 [Helianthus annuus]|nr:hypothetical protein HanIR_Chr11g0504411 [Helianthus annuus]